MRQLQTKCVASLQCGRCRPGVRDEQTEPQSGQTWGTRPPRVTRRVALASPRPRCISTSRCTSRLTRPPSRSTQFSPAWESTSTGHRSVANHRTAQSVLRLARDLQVAVSDASPQARTEPVAYPISLFDSLVTESELRAETRQLFVDGHYAQAVEEGYKFLNNFVKRRTGLATDGASLMTTAFSATNPVLKLT
ncbi:MAG: hypothetical protein E6G39_07195, partial [Actinobacteria bacterium]